MTSFRVDCADHAIAVGYERGKSAHVGIQLLARLCRTQLCFRLVKRQPLLVQLGLRGKVLGEQLLGTLDVHPRLGYPASCRISLRTRCGYLQRFLRGIELEQRLAALDMAPDFHHARDDLAGCAESQLTFVARTNLA
ncbi:hypothetical protein D3C72_1452970 [compost metagenome]